MTATASTDSSAEQRSTGNGSDGRNPNAWQQPSSTSTTRDVKARDEYRVGGRCDNHAAEGSGQVLHPWNLAGAHARQPSNNQHEAEAPGLNPGARCRRGSRANSARSNLRPEPADRLGDGLVRDAELDGGRVITARLSREGRPQPDQAAGTPGPERYPEEPPPAAAQRRCEFFRCASTIPAGGRSGRRPTPCRDEREPMELAFLARDRAPRGQGMNSPRR